MLVWAVMITANQASTAPNYIEIHKRKTMRVWRSRYK